MSPDGVVSFNLRQAREVRGWTQPEAAQHVSRYLGKEWSAQVYGDAERAYRLKRVKVFSAEEVLAFCQAFRLPLVWFYLPPHPWTRIIPRGASDTAAITGEDLLSLIFPRLDDPALADLQGRTDRLFSEYASQRPHRENTATYLNWVNRQNGTLRSMLWAAFKTEDVDGLPEALEELAARTRRAIGRVTDDIRHDGIPAPPAQQDAAVAPAELPEPGRDN